MLDTVVRLGFLVVVGVASAIFLKRYLNPSTEGNYQERRDPPQRPPPTRRRRRGHQKETLINQLCSNGVQCFCMEMVSPDTPVYFCAECYNIFHLSCIKRWANSASSEIRDAWPCPTCMVPNHSPAWAINYKCMCGQTNSPVSRPGLTPHCCLKKCPNCHDRWY